MYNIHTYSRKNLLSILKLPRQWEAEKLSYTLFRYSSLDIFHIFHSSRKTITKFKGKDWKCWTVWTRDPQDLRGSSSSNCTRQYSKRHGNIFKWMKHFFYFLVVVWTRIFPESYVKGWGDYPEFLFDCVFPRGKPQLFAFSS